MDQLIQLMTRNLLGGLNLLLVIFCAYVAAQVVHNIRRPAPALSAASRQSTAVVAHASAQRTFNAYKPILDRNLFKSTLEDQPTRPEPEVPEEVEESPLQAKLVATIVSVDQAKSSATIEDLTSHERAIYHVNDELMKEASIARIERERVIVLRNGQHEKLSLYEEEGEGGAQAAGRGAAGFPGPRIAGQQGITAPRGGLRNFGPSRTDTGYNRRNLSAVSNFNVKKNEFRVMPRFKAGRVAGFRVFGLASKSEWSKSGLRNGDIVRTINGREVSEVKEVYDLLSELKGSSEMTLEVDRGNQTETITYGGGS